MASYMPIGVFGNLLEIGRQPGQPTAAKLRRDVEDRIAELDRDLGMAVLPGSEALRIKDELRQRIQERISTALAAPATQPDLNLKIVLDHALDLLRSG